MMDTDKDRLGRLFELQTILNDKVFEKHGIPVEMCSISGDANAEYVTPTGLRSDGPNGLPCIWLRNYTLAMKKEIEELEAELPWKWWSKEKLNTQNIRVELIDILHFLISACMASGMTADDVFRIYTQKHAVNEKRQEDGYSKATKDEKDNLSIS